MRKTTVLLGLLMIAACSKADNEPGPGGVTVGEARALDEAAEMLEERRVPIEAIPSAAPPPPGQVKPSAAPAKSSAPAPQSSGGRTG